MNNDKRCHTHTYLTEKEESELARLILKEVSEQNGGKTSRPIPAPSGLCDLIF